MKPGVTTRLLVAIATVAFAVGAAACKRGPEDEPGEQDTLAIEVPPDVEERFEEGARQIGGRVGEALEETGQAIERAGERIQEEVGEPADTAAM